MEVLSDRIELHLASFGLAVAELRLAGYDDPAFAALKDFGVRRRVSGEQE